MFCDMEYCVPASLSSRRYWTVSRNLVYRQILLLVILCPVIQVVEGRVIRIGKGRVIRLLRLLRRHLNLRGLLLNLKRLRGRGCNTGSRRQPAFAASATHKHITFLSLGQWYLAQFDMSHFKTPFFSAALAALPDGNDARLTVLFLKLTQ